MHTDLRKLKATLEAKAKADLAEATAVRHAYLHGKLFTSEGEFIPGVCNDAEMEAIKDGLGGKQTKPMIEGKKRHGDQDLVDYVLGSLSKKSQAAVRASIKAHAA